MVWCILWNAKEFLSAVKDNIGGSFPYDLEEYVPVIESGEEYCKDFVLEEWGIENPALIPSNTCLQGRRQVPSRLHPVLPLENPLKTV